MGPAGAVECNTCQRGGGCEMISVRKVDRLSSHVCGASIAAEWPAKRIIVDAQPCRGGVIARLSSPVPSRRRAMSGTLS